VNSTGAKTGQMVPDAVAFADVATARQYVVSPSDYPPLRDLSRVTGPPTVLMGRQQRAGESITWPPNRTQVGRDSFIHADPDFAGLTDEDVVQLWHPAGFPRTPARNNLLGARL
jgi:hypothetical protein